MNIIIHFLKAEHGDSFLIEAPDEENAPTIMIVDGGMQDTFKRHLAPLIKKNTTMTWPSN